MRSSPFRPCASVLVAALVLAAGGRTAAVADGAQGADGAASDEPGREIFFRAPDRATAERIADLIVQATADSVASRKAARAELEALGHWSVAPLVAALSPKTEPPIRCASALVLDAIGDRRALGPLREALLRETSHPLVGAFVALALGRAGDADAVPVFREALRNPRNLDMLRAAVPLALARVRGAESRELLQSLLADGDAKEPVTAARFLALGFFGDAALDPSGTRPAPPLAAAIEKGKRRGERQAALLAFLVATARRREGKEYLAQVLDAEDKPDVVRVALIGYSSFDGADVTERLAKVAAGSSADSVREVACDLLVRRADAAAKPTLLRILASPQSARLRASAMLALAAIDDDECRDVLLERLRADKAPSVKAAAAVGATRSASKATREEAARRIDARLRVGEPDAGARAVFQLARSVLAGERTDVEWPEPGPDALFSETSLPYERRLLRAVNRRAEACLDLAKIHNLQNDTEIKAGGGTDLPGSGDDGGDGGDDGGFPDAPNPGDTPIGAQRTSAWQELRDLKIELERRPYFGASDLPGAPAAATGGK